MIVQFASADHFEPGKVLLLISQAWSQIWCEKLEEEARRFDAEVYANPDTVGACTFITTLDDVAVGLFSWDPRQHPESVRIGWNCVVPESRRHGIGRVQIQAMLERFKKRGFRKVLVTTCDHPFYVPAQKMYLKCGFTEVGRRTEPTEPLPLIDYQRIL